MFVLYVDYNVDDLLRICVYGFVVLCFLGKGLFCVCDV